MPFLMVIISVGGGVFGIIFLGDKTPLHHYQFKAVCP